MNSSCKPIAVQSPKMLEYITKNKSGKEKTSSKQYICMFISQHYFLKNKQSRKLSSTNEKDSFEYFRAFRKIKFHLQTFSLHPSFSQVTEIFFE